MWHYFYPRSPCGERLLRRFPNMSLRIISIHALLAESDGGRCPPRHRHGRFLSTLSLRRATLSQDYTEQPTDISIHALLAESDLDALCARCPGLKFLSTLSLRRATHNLEELGYLLIISIHALLAESDFIKYCHWRPPYLISIHALLAESDCSRLSQPNSPPVFLSTLSLRRATTL